MSPEERAAVVAEAQTWLGTPYHPCARLKGIGVDCAMFLLGVYQATGLVPADFDPGDYPPQFGLHRDEERFLGIVERFARRTDDPQPGDCALFHYGRCYSHGAILIGDGLLVHAVLRDRAVVMGALSDADLALPARKPLFFTVGS